MCYLKYCKKERKGDGLLCCMYVRSWATCLEASDYAFVRGVAWGGIMIGFGWMGGG